MDIFVISHCSLAEEPEFTHNGEQPACGCGLEAAVILGITQAYYKRKALVRSVFTAVTKAKNPVKHFTTFFISKVICPKSQFILQYTFYICN